MKDFIKGLWASPNTLLGRALLAIGGGDYGEKTRGHYMVSSGSLLQRGMRRIGINAITFGRCVIYSTDRYNDRRYRHECEHVKQYEKWGPLFLPLYGAASVMSRIKHGSWYRHNHFECEARERE